MSELLRTELERVGQSWTTLDELVRSLSDEQMTEFKQDRWSVKDHLAHLAVAERFCRAALQERSLHESVGTDRETFLHSSEDELNEIIYRHYQSTPLSDILTLRQKAHEELFDTLTRISDADLQRPFARNGSEPTGMTMLDVLSGNTYQHYDAHRGWIQAIVDQGTTQSR